MTWRQSNDSSTSPLFHLSVASLTRNVTGKIVVHRCTCMNLVGPVHLRQVVGEYKHSITLFTDSQTERNVFVERVYPKLREYCREKYGVEFQVMMTKIEDISLSRNYCLRCHRWTKLSEEEIQTTQSRKGISNTIWARSWDYGTYHIGDQRRLRCSHTWSMEVDRHLAPLDGCACAFEERVYGGWKVP